MDPASSGSDPAVLAALQRPGNLVFPSNQAYSADFHARGGRVIRQKTGHLIFYTPEGRRFLAVEPGGVALHECEWRRDGDRVRLQRARVHLESDGWVGIRPKGLLNQTVLDLRTRPGWQQLRVEDLHALAARALHVLLEEVRFFYGDEDLIIDPGGTATIRHNKDALYLLMDGTFEAARFMSCMGAMHWERIDFLPVVELFQSLVPGTGSAVFELIRGLYDDQREAGADPLPLRYRGIPTYPSAGAFRLFSAFFAPTAPAGQDPLRVFMDPSRASEVLWRPAADAPRRYFDLLRRLCVTIKGETVQRVTQADDPTGLSYSASAPGRPAAGDRRVSVQDGWLVLRDDQAETRIPLDPAWGPLKEGPSQSPAAGISWRAVFAGSPPTVSPPDAFTAVALYPDDAAEIDEPASQSFVADHLADLVEAIGPHATSPEPVLIDNMDAAIAACVGPDARPSTVIYARPAFAQRQAQLLFNQWAAAGRLDRLQHIRFVPASQPAPTGPYSLAYLWLPFAEFGQIDSLRRRLGTLSGQLTRGARAFVVGPDTLSHHVQAAGLAIRAAESVEELPPFRMHRTILPKARLKPGLTLFHLYKA